MHQTQLAITEVKRFIKRRKKILLLAPLLLVGTSIAAALLLPPKYESSISILVERDETLNPMIQYTMAVAMASEDRLRSFNEILYSRSTMNMLIDSLGLDNDLPSDNGDHFFDNLQNKMTGFLRTRTTDTDSHTRRANDDLINKVRSDVRTNLRASDSFVIYFMHQKPEVAKKGVELLANHFIQTRLALENRRNEQTVSFFENKLDELETAVKEREERIMSYEESNIGQSVRDNRSIQSNIEEVENSLTSINREIKKTEQSLEVLRSINRGESEFEAIRELDISRFTSGSEMRENLNLLRDYSQRYTSQFPRVRQLERKLIDLTDRMIVEIESALFEQRSEKSYLQNQRAELVNQLEQTTVTQQVRSGVRSDYDVYKTMLDDMKVKVEQARSTRELGDRAEDQFVVIDSANVPDKPAKPNRRLMVAGGLFIGIFLGVVGAGVAELLDTTIRRPEDLIKFNKPIMAFVPNSADK